MKTNEKAPPRPLSASDIKPNYEGLHEWESYSSALLTEYRQSIEEGLDIEPYADLFAAVAALPKGEIKKKLGDVLFEIVLSAPTVEGYKYVEPSDLDGIRELRRGNLGKAEYDRAALPDRIAGAWLGRIAGCLLGKPIECIKTNELHPFLRETDNFPLKNSLIN